MMRWARLATGRGVGAAMAQGWRDACPPGVNSPADRLESAAMDIFKQFTLEAAHRLPLTASDVLLPLAYGVGYIAIVLLVAVAVFERRDLR